MPRQQRGMQIDDGAPGRCQNVGAEDLPVSHHHDDVRCQRRQLRAHLPDDRRLPHRHSRLQRLQLERRRLQRLVAAHRLVRLGHQRQRPRSHL